MRLIYLFLLLPLAACEGGMQPVDAQKLLSTLDGPKVATVQDTVIESARNAESQGKFSEAAQFYQQALEKQPYSKELMVALGDNFRRSGENDRAISVYDTALVQDANFITAKEGKGLALMAKGDFDMPGVLFGEVIKVDATRWKSLNGLGILFSTRSMQKEAQVYYQEALKYSPNNPSVLNNLGLSQAMDRNFDASYASLTQASTLAATGSQDRKRIELNLSLVYAIAGKLDDARAIAERYFSGATLNNNLGLYAHLAKDDQLAKAYLNMAMTDSKTFYERAWNNLEVISNANVKNDGAKSSASTVQQPENAKQPEAVPLTNNNAPPPGNIPFQKAQ